VVGFVDELIGLGVYMRLEALHELIGDGGALSGAFLAVDAAAEAILYRDLKQMPAISGVGLREAALSSFEDTLARSMGIFTTVITVFACVIAMAMVYNAARIALSERGRELASLRVLGFTRGEVALMLLGEHALLTLLAIPVGSVLGYQLCAWIARMYQWELFRLPLIVTAETYAFAICVIMVAAVASALVVRRRLDRLDLVEVLKTRE
jgi:putative ABC transport system permease protein